MKRIYGNEKTHLTLTEKAESAYNNYGSIRIVEDEYEEDGEKEYRYFIFCFFFGDIAMTAEQINEYLEDLADKI